MKENTFLKKLKIASIIASIIVISLCVVLFIGEKLFWHIYSLPKHNEKEIQNFSQFKDDAEAVNGYIIENFGHTAITNDNSILVSQENGIIVGLYDEGHIEIPEHMLDAFNNIKDRMHQSDTDFFIDITKDRISYGGLSSYMYVYSRNGKSPSFFYHKGDGMHPEVYDLGNNWYLLEVNFR